MKNILITSLVSITIIAQCLASSQYPRLRKIPSIGSLESVSIFQELHSNLPEQKKIAGLFNPSTQSKLRASGSDPIETCFMIMDEFTPVDWETEEILGWTTKYESGLDEFQVTIGGHLAKYNHNTNTIEYYDKNSLQEIPLKIDSLSGIYSWLLTFYRPKLVPQDKAELFTVMDKHEQQ